VVRPAPPAGRHGIETSASAGEVQGQSQVEQPAGPLRNIDHYRRFYVVGGLEYSPAPILYHEFAGDEEAKKVPDHFGPTISFDVRLAGYLLLGAQAGLSIPSGARQFQTTVHVGGLLPLSGRTCLLGRAGAGLSWLRIDQGRLADSYTGLHAWLGLGLRHQFTELLGLEVQLAGAVADLGGAFGEVTQLRLLLSMGLVFGFGG
jgi:hypothetical protein